MLFKAVFAFLSVGGATYTFLHLNKAPAWLKFATVTMAVAALLLALPELPKGIDGIAESARKIAAMFPAPPPSVVTQQLPSANSDPPLPRLPDPAPVDLTPS